MLAGKLTTLRRTARAIASTQRPVDGKRVAVTCRNHSSPASGASPSARQRATALRREIQNLTRGLRDLEISSSRVLPD